MANLTNLCLMLTACALAGCKSNQAMKPVLPLTSAPNATGSQDPYARLDELKSRYPWYTWASGAESPKLAEELAPVRKSEAWRSFVHALRACDDAVNTLCEQDITEWIAAKPVIAPINRARNAWRRACTFGIKPPKLSTGYTSFEDDGIGFRVYVVDDTTGVLIARSQRGQVIGIFDVRLDPSNRQHVTCHMLENALRYPNTYLNYPFNRVMATDTLRIPDVTVDLDRIKGEAHVHNAVTGEVEVKK